jgi:hypothetical protein
MNKIKTIFVVSSAAIRAAARDPCGALVTSRSRVNYVFIGDDTMADNNYSLKRGL